MTKEELKQIISQGETETVEFKATGRLLVATVAKVITAFLNSHGGKLIIGVKEPGQIIGIEEEQINRLKFFTIRVALRNIKPKATAILSTMGIDGKRVVVIEVPEGKTKPYGYHGTYFTREGDIIVEMAQTDLLDFFGSQEKYDKRSITEILEKVKAIEAVLKDNIQNKLGTNIFISHGHHPEIKEKVEDFIESLELNPVVVMDSSSDGLSVDDKVDKYIKKCAASIILYTPDHELTDGTFLPRQNVIHETGLLQRIMPDKVIYLKEKTVKLPTNITPKVYVSFEKDNLTEAIIQIVKELKSFGVL
ncbi:hypothetical protein ES708_17464 [subsurface metagenome]